MKSPDNAAFIYQYTEKSFQSVNKSIDIVTDKLTKVLAFSGVLLKFGYDMSPEIFSLKFAVLTCLIGAISFCATGLIPKSPGKITLTPQFLLEEYVLKEADKRRNEDAQILVCRTLVEAIPKLKELRDYRLNLLNYAIGCLIVAGLLFGFAGIISGIK